MDNRKHHLFLYFLGVFFEVTKYFLSLFPVCFVVFMLVLLHILFKYDLFPPSRLCLGCGIRLLLPDALAERFGYQLGLL